MAIDWKNGKTITTMKANQTMLVFLYKKDNLKTPYKMFTLIGKITCYEKKDDSKYGCIKCGKPFDRKKNFVKHWLRLHGKIPIFKKDLNL